jgi:hypothetical protein
MRAHVDRTLPAPAGYPYPAAGIGGYVNGAGP